MIRCTVPSLNVVLLAVVSNAFLCVDEGSLSRRKTCYDGTGRRTCTRLPEELWTGATDRVPSWADLPHSGVASDSSAASRRLQQVFTLTVQINVCGDGWLGAIEGEECDDGNPYNNDGCSSTCRIEPGFACFPSVTHGRYFEDPTGSILSVCEQNRCGDGVIHQTEQCDDNNNNNHDGCSAACIIEPNYFCEVKNKRTVCQPPFCGDGRRATSEECDDGNVAGGDGCDGSCHLERQSPYNCRDTCEVDCHLYANQRRTLCVPIIQTTIPTPAPVPITATQTVIISTVTPTITKTYVDEPEAGLTYWAKEMTNIKVWPFFRCGCAPRSHYGSGKPLGFRFLPVGPLNFSKIMFSNIQGPCSFLLNGKFGCCSHLSEDPEYAVKAAEPIRDLEMCKWPAVGYRVVRSGTCESHGHYTVVSMEDCTVAAMSLHLGDMHPTLLANATRLSPHTIHVAVEDKFGTLLEYSGIYDIKSSNEYMQRSNYRPGTASIRFLNGRWHLYQTSIAEKWLMSFHTLIGMQRLPQCHPIHTFPTLLPTPGTWQRTNPEDLYYHSLIPYLKVKQIGERFRMGCNLQRHSTKDGRLVFRPPAPSAHAEDYGLCSDEVGCVCRLDALGITQLDYTPQVEPMCSYLLHQLHCGYSCLAPYQFELEPPGCHVHEDCPPGGLCVYPVLVAAMIAELEAELQDAVKREASYLIIGFPRTTPMCGVLPCKSSDELTAEILAARESAIGTCRGTGMKMPPCDSWLQRVYSACRFEPVSFIPWASSLNPPVHHCQPLWWKYRDYDSFRLAFGASKAGNGQCWSAGNTVSVSAALSFLAGMVIFIT